MSRASGYAVICGHTAYEVPLDALCSEIADPGHQREARKVGLPALHVAGTARTVSMTMGQMLLGRQWPVIWRSGQGGSVQPGVVLPEHVRVLKGTLEKDGPEVRVWYIALEPAHQFNDPSFVNGPDKYILWRMPPQIVAKCLEYWYHELDDPRVMRLLHPANLPSVPCKAFNPVLSGWKVSKTHSSEVLTLWKRVRLYARLKGQWRAALLAWHDEVHHRPQHICNKDDHGETEAARAMEAEMTAPVFTAGRLQ